MLILNDGRPSVIPRSRQVNRGEQSLRLWRFFIRSKQLNETRECECKAFGTCWRLAEPGGTGFDQETGHWSPGRSEDRCSLSGVEPDDLERAGGGGGSGTGTGGTPGTLKLPRCASWPRCTSWAIECGNWRAGSPPELRGPSPLALASTALTTCWNRCTICRETSAGITTSLRPTWPR